MKGEMMLILTQEELEKCENPYKEIEKMAKGLVEELQEREYNRGYEKGMEDCWEMVKKLYLSGYGLAYSDLTKIFVDWDFETILTSNSAKEAKEKIDNYIKEKSEFHVGDEVRRKDGSSIKGVIIRIKPGDYCPVYCVIFENAYTGSYDENTVRFKFNKTGRHFDEVKELFKKMKED